MDLIKINQTESGMSIDARELHTFLEIGRDFTNWIKDRIEKYGFIEGEDFSPKLAKTQESGRPRIDYELSIDMAKELCMVENNARGRQARKYFIEVDKRYKRGESRQLNAFADPTLGHFKKEALMLQLAADMLRLPDSGKLKLMIDFNKAHGLNVPLPAYADEPITESATALLKKHGASIQTTAFNMLLIAYGLLEEKERPSSKGGIKLFKSLTDAGLEYGKNIISPNNPRETQPHYYADKFNDLLKFVGL